MKVIITADLHYNVLRSREPTQRLARDIDRASADVLILVGDSAGHDLGILCECLHLFDSFEGSKLLVVGNHELWSHRNDSLDRYENQIPTIARDAGFHCLDERPFVRDGVGFVGSVGWYDYSFRDRGLEVPMRFYEAKIGPGGAKRLREYRHLLDEKDDLPSSADEITSRWMDGAHVRLPYSDVEFADLLGKKLEDHLRGLSEELRTVVACVHHLPFEELVKRPPNASWRFAAAFLGASCFGRTLLKYPKVSHVYCGHSHQRGRIRKGTLECINVGSTYRTKRFETLEL